MNIELKKFLRYYSVIVKYNCSSLLLLLPERGESGPEESMKDHDIKIGDKIMKSYRTLMMLVALVAFSIIASAQSERQKSDAQRSFDAMKALAGNWTGPVTVDPPQADTKMDKPIHVSLRVTSRGNAIVHEMQEDGAPLDATKADHPVTMFYLEGDQLTLVHYCDAGNRPSMVARPSPDGKTVEFDFANLSGGNQFGHMYHAVFKIIDANHHTEDRTFMMPGDKPMRGHMDLQRVN